MATWEDRAMRQRWKAIRTGARLALACLIVAAAALADASALAASAAEHLEAGDALTTGSEDEPAQGAADEERLEGTSPATQPEAEPATPSSSQPLYVHRPSYREYLNAHEGAPSPDVEIVIPAVTYSAKSPDMEVRRLTDA